MRKTKEELEELKNEYQSFCSKIAELDSEELSAVAGGVASGSSYKELGILPCGNFQFENNHPIIVTIFNSCSLSKNVCCSCIWSEKRGLTLYCQKRSKENDPCNGGVEYDPFTGKVIKQY